MILKLGCLFLCLTVGAEALAASPYAGTSDEQLTELTAQWVQLSSEERRALLTEVKSRMNAQRRKGKTPVLRIRTERRFGRTVRQPDGSLVRIETRQQIVRYRALDAEHPFGTGFERRMAGTPAAETAQQSSLTPVTVDLEKNAPAPAVERLPVLRVSHPFRQ